MYTLGEQGRNSPRRQEGVAGGPPCRTSWHRPNEGSGSQLCVVAQDGQKHRRACDQVHGMPRVTTCTSSCLSRRMECNSSTVVSDDGAQFTSEKFRTFLKAGLIRHITSAPFHPSTNGQAERMVHTTKDSLQHIVKGNMRAASGRFSATAACNTMHDDRQEPSGYADEEEVEDDT